MTTIGTGELPQSDALAEASPESLGILMDKDPESYSRQDRDRIIAAFRANRARLAQAEAASPGARRLAQTKVAAAPKVGSFGDIDL